MIKLSYLNTPACTTTCISLSLFAASLATNVCGQDPEEETEVYELNPFTVDGSDDQGYLTPNTLSGTRLKSSLKDTAAAISVFNRDLIDDLAADSIDDLADYAVNTDRTNGIISGLANGNEFTSGDTNFKIRGLPTAGRMVNFFSRSLEVDTFNTQYVEAARGPNAVLYGLGQPGGAFNATTKKAGLNEQAYEASVKLGSYDYWRVTFDANLPVISEKFGVRVNVAKDSQNDYRPHEFQDSERFHIAARYQFTPSTTLDLEYEYADVSRNQARPWLGFDSFTDWRTEGSPMDNTPAAGGVVPGLQLVSGNNYVVHYSGENVLYDNRRQTQSVTSVANSALLEPMILDFDTVPRDAVLGGSGTGIDIDLDVFTGTFQHKLFENFYIEAAYYKQEAEVIGRDFGNRDIRIIYDTNTYLPDGTPNPYAGEPYVEGIMTYRNRWEDIDDYRFSANYTLDLGDIWGRHLIAGLVEHREEATYTENLSEFFIDNPINTSRPDHPQNRIRRRTYVDLDGPVENIALADWRDNEVVNMPLYNSTGDTGTTLTSTLIPSNMRDTRFEMDSALAVLQSRFLKDRVIASFGYRKDKISTLESTVEREDPFGPFNTGLPYAVLGDEPFENEGITRNLGLVAHPTEWLTFSYNHASSFAAQNRAITIFPNDPAPTPKGEGDDIGVRFNLIDNKLYATLTYYETSANQDSGFLNRGLTSGGITNIWETLDLAGILVENGIVLDDVVVDNNGYLLDSESEGLELEVIANPTRNWRLLFNFSDNQTVNSNIATEFFDYVDANDDFWLQGHRNRLIIDSEGELADEAVDPTDGVTTIQEAYNNVMADADNRFSRPDGTFILGTPQYSANFRTNYTFRDGILNRFSIGGGLRWRGEAPIGYTTSDPETREPINAADNTQIDLSLGYTLPVKLSGDNARLSFQVNVSNLLDEDDLIVTGAYDDGSIRTYRFQDPRKVYFTTRLSF